jgi:predicted nicotinamide N-methyase
MLIPVMWPSAVVLSRWLVTNPSFVRNKKILEIGAGCGLVGLVAAGIVKESAANESVIMTDFNDVVLHNLDRNIQLNNVQTCAWTRNLDFFMQTGESNAGSWIDGSTGNVEEPVDVILAADIICKPDDATAAANTIFDVLRPGGEAIVVCADARHRFGVDRLILECDRVGLITTSYDVRSLYDGGLLTGSSGEDGLYKTCGYIDDMELTLFRISKRQQTPA